MTAPVTAAGALDRRQFLRAVGATVAAGTLGSVAGCVALGSTGELVVRVTNEDDVDHTVGVVVTDSTGTDVEEFPAERIQPGVSTSFTGDGYGGDEYVIAVQEGEGDTPQWRQTTRWVRNTCSTLTYTVRITRRANGNSDVIAATECDSS